MKRIISLSLAIVALASCTIKEAIPESSPFIKLGDENISIPKAGGIKTIAVQSNCEWTAEASETWVKIAPSFGNASTSAITVQVLENPGTEERKATLTVKGNTTPAEAVLNIKQSNIAKVAGDIETADEFADFLANATTATDADTFTLLADIDMEGRTLEPATSFAGKFDGKDHKVYNYKIASKQATTGIFLTVTGSISDVIFGSKDGNAWDGVSEVGFDSSVSAASNVGGVAATLGGTLSGVKSFAKVITPTGNAAECGVGGLVGNIEASTAVVEKCVNYGTLAVSGTVGAGSYYGGVVGWVKAGGATITGCTNKADQDITIRIAKFIMYGGIVGCINGSSTLSDSVNDGNISYTQQNDEKNGTYMMIAGIIGAVYNAGTVTNCINNGLVSSNNLQVSRIGGIIGTLNSGGTIEKNINNGEVIIKHAAANDNWQAAGGICGFQEKGSGNVVKDNINNGAVSVDVNITTTHANQVAAGGIIGIGILNYDITGNVNNGAVTFDNKGTTPAHVGGIAGWLKAASVKMADNENKAAVNGSTPGCTGALAGTNDGVVNGDIAGGSVNGTAVTATNIGTLAIGNGSGTATGIKTGSGEVANTLDVDKTSIDVDADAVSASFNVTSNTAWTVSCSAAWLTSFTKSGNGDGVVSITFPANTSTTDARTATFTVSADKVDAKTVTLTQNKVLASDPLCIPNAEELALFAKATAAATPDLSRWTNAGVVALSADIDASTLKDPIALIPEGVVFDGKNFKIYNIELSSNGNSGLILSNKGTVKNLVAGSKDGSSWDGKSIISANGAAFNMGLIADNAGKVENVKNFVKMNYNAANAAGMSGMGGVVGAVTAACEITSCFNYGTIGVDNALNVSSILCMGGVVGYCKVADVSVTYCENRAPVLITAKNAQVFHIGGVIGYLDYASTVANCINYERVAYEQGVAAGTWMSVGGVCGSIYHGGTLMSCENKGEVYTNLQQVTRIGGIVGVLNSGANVQNCTNNGKVRHEQASSNGNWQAVGGVVGFEEKGSESAPIIVKNNTNNAEVYFKTNITTTHANKIAVGGVFGMACSYTQIEGNTNNGAVTGNNEGDTELYAGGILGWYLKGSALATTGNVNTAAVSATAKVGAVGGFVGNQSISACTCTGEKNTGAVTGTFTGFGDAGAVCGIIAGLNAGSLANCQAGGTVNGAAAATTNVQGSNSAGSATLTTIL